MGKVKYQKSKHSNVGSKVISKQPYLKRKEELLARLLQRRKAITPNDINFQDKFSDFDNKKILQYKLTTKVQDNLHLPRQNKRARKRMLARKKLAGAFGNISSLADALPSVEENSKNRSVKEKPRIGKTLKAQEMEMIKEINWYHGAVQDPSFHADPWEACANYVNRLLMNEQKKSS